MDEKKFESITVDVLIDAPVEKVWSCWSKPEHIVKWCHASDDWHAPYAENDLSERGRFKTTMAAHDGSTSFDFEGVYTFVQPYKRIEYAMADGRQVKITFKPEDGKVRVTETFDAETENPLERQREGWQAILNNFRDYIEKG